MTTTNSASDRSGGAGLPPYGIPPGGFRLPAATRVGAVRLQVADLTRSLAYYEGLLGLRAVVRDDARAVLGPNGDGAEPLVELHERAGAKRVPPRGRLGLFHFAILLPGRADLGRFAAHLQQAGVAAGASDHLVSEALYLSDPDGLGIEVYADRPRETWQYAGRELRMDTLPLDVEGLLREAGSAAWEGMPPGTTIGHVHLHVGELPAAEAFYHLALGLDQIVWSYPGARFLSAGGYHHHLGINTWAAGAEPAGEDDARLIEWELVVPAAGDARAALESLTGAGFTAEAEEDGGTARDPWGTRVRIRAAGAGGSA